jgi:N-acetylglucosamine kinase-like BadF-type ATPase
MRLFLGVDGGQSGTTAVIGDERGRVLGTGEAGPCNHAAAGEGRAKLERAVTGSVGAARAQAGLAAAVRFEAACFGMSGGPDDKREILSAILPVDHLLVTNDAVIALSGATSTGQGIVTIAGTGSIAFGRNPAGHTARAGGWGHVFGDEGGGFDIARQAVRAAVRQEEGWGPASVLRQRLLAATGSKDANEMLHLFYSDEWPRSRVATLAPLVDSSARDGDAVALDILGDAARQLAALADAVRRHLWELPAPVEIAYIGGVFQSDILLRSFRTLVEAAEGVRCIAPRRGPALGALREAYRSLGLELDTDRGTAG